MPVRSTVEGPDSPDPKDDAGVDRSLIRSMLELNPLERAQKAGALAHEIVILRGRNRSPHSAPRLGAHGIRGAASSFTEVLEVVASSDAEVLVVGMLAAVLQGAPLVTFGADLVHRDTPENAAKVAALLERLGADLVTRTDRESDDAHEQADTPRVDVTSHRVLVDGLTYQDLLEGSVQIELESGMSIRAISLEQVIDLKKRLARPKDRAALPALEATLEEVRARGAAP